MIKKYFHRKNCKIIGIFALDYTYLGKNDHMKNAIIYQNIG
jgi:hypothetical protein